MDHLKQYEVSIVTAPLITACMSRQVMSIDEFGYYYSGIFERITRDHLTPTHHVGAVYYDQALIRQARTSHFSLASRKRTRPRAPSAASAVRTCCTRGRIARCRTPMRPSSVGLRKTATPGTVRRLRSMSRISSTAVRRRNGKRRSIFRSKKTPKRRMPAHKSVSGHFRVCARHG